MLLRPTFALAAFAAFAAAAQTPPAPNAPREPLDPRRNQKIERIVVEDDSNRIDELRMGGQTERITVQPKGGMPGYQIQPANLARTPPSEPRDGLAGTTGKRFWNLSSF